MAELLPPSAFESSQDNEESPRKRLFQYDFDDFNKKASFEELQRKMIPCNSFILESPQKETRIYESAMKNQATLIEQLNNRIANYEIQIVSLQQQLAHRQDDLETMARQCEESLSTLDQEHAHNFKKVELELSNCRKLLEHESALRLQAERRFQDCEEENKQIVAGLQASLQAKCKELQEARDESAKLRLYFTGGRDLIASPSFEERFSKPAREPMRLLDNSETINTLRVQIEALQHIIDVQEEQLRTSKPDVIPGLATLEKWRRKVYETMVRGKLDELSAAKQLFQMRQEVAGTKEQLKICEAKLTAKEIELKEIKSRFEVHQKLVVQSSGNEAKFRECLQTAAQGIAHLGVMFKETASKSMLQIANMERRLELATKRIKQIGTQQKSAARLEQLLNDANSARNSQEMQLVIAQETVEDLRRQLTVCQHQLASAAKQKASALETLENDRAAERESSTAQIRSLTSELQELRVEHAKLIANYSSVKRRLDEAEQQCRELNESLSSRLKETQQDYDALAKVAREHGVVDRIAARRAVSPVGSISGGGTADAVRAQVESLYKSLIR